MYFNKQGRELWDSISSLLTSPVQKVWYIEKNSLPSTMPLCATYDTALSHYTFLADTSLPSFVMDKKVFAEHRTGLLEYLHPEDGNVRLELWKYSPELLAEKQFVDRLSLVLCYKETDDERVRKEINVMINGIAW